MKRLVAAVVLSAFSAIATGDNRSDQMNPNNDSYWQSRGYDERPDDWGSALSSPSYSYSKEDYDNRSNQLNPNNSAYWSSRGYASRPDNLDADAEDEQPYAGDHQSPYNEYSSSATGKNVTSNGNIMLGDQGRAYSSPNDDAVARKGEVENRYLMALKMTFHFLSVR